MQKNEITYSIYNEKDLEKCIFPLAKGDKIFFFGDLGAGKTTFIRSLIRNYFKDNAMIIRSPTYTYYQEYGTENNKFFHFDLYRLEDEETFYMIGGNDILSSNESISLIEWPEILNESIMPTKTVHISYDSVSNMRTITVKTF